MFHISRWRFWIAYSVVFVLVMFAIWAVDSGFDSLAWTGSIIAALLFASLEVMVRYERLSLDANEAVFSKGILKRNVVRAPYRTIMNVSVNQAFVQRVLYFGDVSIDTSGGHGPEIVLTGFFNPQKIERLLKSKMHAHREHKEVKK